MATAFTVTAQQKPTKEETVTFLDKVYKMSIGYKHYALLDGKRDPDVEFLITNCDFELNSVSMEEMFTKGKTKGNATYSNLHWENVTEIIIEKDPQVFYDDEIVRISINFLTKITYENSFQAVSKDYVKSMMLYVIKNKAYSFKKGLERLAAIAKEENKDPFQN